MAANTTIGGDDSFGRYGSGKIESSIGLGVSGITIKGITKTYATYQEMLEDRQPGRFAYVIDASGDPTVDSGFAYYVAENGIWKKLFEQEVMDVNTSGHTHTNKEVLDLFSIQNNRPMFDNKALAYQTEIEELQQEIDQIETEITTSGQFHYEFIDEGSDKDGIEFELSEKTYIVRNARMIGQLPLGTTMSETVCFRLVVDEASAAKEEAGVIYPSTGETICGESEFVLSDSMDVRIIYDSKNKDWVVIGTLDRSNPM